MDAVLRGVLSLSALHPLARINTYLIRWLRKKHKRLRGQRRAREAWENAVQRTPRYLAHWAWVTHPLMTRTARAV
ncbi:hypothetical protein GCM10028784_18210 [Myceligenerans cantabricum]